MAAETQTEGVPDGELLKAAFSVAADSQDAAERTRVSLALRARIGELLPVVQTQMDRLPPRSREWYARDTAIFDAQEDLKRGLSPSPMAASLTLAELGRRLRTLCEFTDGQS